TATRGTRYCDCACFGQRRPAHPQYVRARRMSRSRRWRLLPATAIASSARCGSSWRGPRPMIGSADVAVERRPKPVANAGADVAAVGQQVLEIVGDDLAAVAFAGRQEVKRE